jgi:hypothetical protein
VGEIGGEERKDERKVKWMIKRYQGKSRRGVWVNPRVGEIMRREGSSD